MKADSMRVGSDRMRVGMKADSMRVGSDRMRVDTSATPKMAESQKALKCMMVMASRLGAIGSLESCIPNLRRGVAL
eukprot:4574089-Amphidinium_carterae.1